MSNIQPSPMDMFTKQTSLLEDICVEQKSLNNKLAGREIKRFSLNRHSGTGAVIAALFGTIWILQYLLTTVIGILEVPLWKYVVGTWFNMNTDAAELLFIIIARFLVVFGVTWAPITFILALFEKRK